MIWWTELNWTAVINNVRRPLSHAHARLHRYPRPNKQVLTLGSHLFHQPISHLFIWVKRVKHNRHKIKIQAGQLGQAPTGDQILTTLSWAVDISSSAPLPRVTCKATFYQFQVCLTQAVTAAGAWTKSSFAFINSDVRSTAWFDDRQPQTSTACDRRLFQCVDL